MTDPALTVDLQNVSDGERIPAHDRFEAWAAAALQHRDAPVELTDRRVDEEESAALNETYRDKQGPTNVLSFPFEMPAEIDEALGLLGDLVICVPVVQREAREQGKDELAHWAHMVVHGTLHLQGFDHLTAAEAERMEGLERVIMARLGYSDPYDEEANRPA